MLLFVQVERPRQQLDLMAEKIESHASRQVSQIFELRFPKRDGLLRLIEGHFCGALVRQSFTAKHDEHIRYSKLRLIDCHRRNAGCTRGEGHFPRPFMLAQALVTSEEGRVTN